MDYVIDKNAINFGKCQNLNEKSDKSHQKSITR